MPVDTDIAPDPRVDALEPSWGQQPETGDRCIDLTPRPGIDPGSELGIAWDIATLEMMVDPRLGDTANTFCDGAPVDAAPRPHGAANAFVRSVTLPTPNLRIDPGFALTGMPAYLVIDGQDDFSRSDDLAGWGALTVDFETVAFAVDWGDGTTTLVDDGRIGAPYDGDPTQQISHVYDQRGSDTEVVVTATWRAQWRVAGFSGAVEGLAIESRLALPVREYRAVRVAPDQ